MMVVMGDLHLKECLIYLDDIIIINKSFEKHLSRLEAVFQRFYEANLKLKASECHFMKEKIRYLGHIVSRNGISTNPEKISVVKDGQFPRL